MQNLAAAKAYNKAATFRSPREQETELFTSVSSLLRRARTASPIERTKALAENERLWVLVMDILRDPANQLPVDLKAALLSLGHASRREMSGDAPDFDFLINLNDNIAMGLNQG